MYTFNLLVGGTPRSLPEPFTLRNIPRLRNFSSTLVRWMWSEDHGACRCLGAHFQGYKWYENIAEFTKWCDNIAEFPNYSDNIWVCCVKFRLFIWTLFTSLYYYYCYHCCCCCCFFYIYMLHCFGTRLLLYAEGETFVFSEHSPPI